MSVRRTGLLALATAVLAAAGAWQGALAPAAARAPSARTAGAPTVQSMIVGRGGAVISAAKQVTAAAATLTVDGRSCAVASATPLAVLVAVRQDGGPGFAVHDYGHCNASAVNSAQLFVFSLGGENNRGQSGWEYKVGGAAGSTGAADTSGPTGNGVRILSGERVLWFWCESGPFGCQRTLEVSGPASVSRSHRLVATVYAYDSEGRGSPLAGATVTLGGSRAVSNGRGHATLTAPPRAGRYQLSAGRSGMVQPFPVTIAVR